MSNQRTIFQTLLKHNIHMVFASDKANVAYDVRMRQVLQKTHFLLQKESSQVQGNERTYKTR